MRKKYQSARNNHKKKFAKSHISANFLENYKRFEKMKGES